MARAQAAEAWRSLRREEDALKLARAYFPEFAGTEEKLTSDAPSNPGLGLRVNLPEAERGVMEIATRGHIFRVREIRATEGAVRLPMEAVGAAFYGPQHFWTRVGSIGVEGVGTWLTQRVEEFVVLDGGGLPYHVQYEIDLPATVVAVKDAGEYAEFFDSGNIPVLRLHYPVARDVEGLSRLAEVKLGGCVREGNASTAQRGRVLCSRKVRIAVTVRTEGMSGPVVIDPGWSSTGGMSVGRYKHTGTLLPSGKVLVAGGVGAMGALNTAELYHPASNSWASADSMTVARARHTATLLPSGKVLVTGGSNDGLKDLDIAEVYDPDSDQWQSGGEMNSPRSDHTATLLASSDKVLVSGGYTGGKTAEVYTPPTTWDGIDAGMNVERELHTATLLPSGKVLIAGLGSQVYNPENERWEGTGSMLISGRRYHAATLLPSGEVLIMGGYAGSAVGYPTVAEVYNPGTSSWQDAGTMVSPRHEHTATLLPSGHVIVAGGHDGFGAVSTAEDVRYSGVAGAVWSPIPEPMSPPRRRHTATLLPSGRVLIAGGMTDSNVPLDIVEVYAPPGMTSLPALEVRTVHDGSVVDTGTPAFSGTSEPHSIIGVSLSARCSPDLGPTEDRLLGVVSADASGRWTLPPYSPLSFGEHTITALAFDRAGNAIRCTTMKVTVWETHYTCGCSSATSLPEALVWSALCVGLLALHWRWRVVRRLHGVASIAPPENHIWKAR